MGIRDLLPFLKKHAPDSFRVTNLNLPNSIKSVAVDTPIFMHKYGYVVGSGRPLCARMLKFYRELKERGLEPIFCFDGSSLPEKMGEKSKRFLKMCRSMELKKQRSLVNYGTGDDIEVERSCAPSCFPIPEDYLAFKMALEDMGVVTMTAKFEAEALCSYLCCSGRVQAVISEDSDCAAYMASAILLHCNSREEEVLFDPETACQALNLNPSQFQDLCVLLGNDFNGRIKGVGPEKAWNYLKRGESLSGVLEFLRTEEPTKSQMLATRKIFSTHCYEHPH